MDIEIEAARVRDAEQILKLQYPLWTGRRACFSPTNC